mmetsp:Transcript_15769/g.44280  ORF Transcript_15769/g.44280 Transcript_15769/m.44280 type:complete len:101 (+) Transcript_15769:2392-2694(+)
MACTPYASPRSSQLYEKRVLDAKYHLLERLKANVWCLYETGIISGITSSKLKKAVLDELDELDMNRHTGDGVLAFDPLHRRLAKTSSFHRRGCPASANDS